MQCERCGSDTHVERHEIDGFVGYLCRECLAVWEELRSVDA